MLTQERTKRIFDLMCEVDQLRLTGPDWGQPLERVLESSRGQAILHELMAEENREALRAWYSPVDGRGLNPGAARMKEMLEWLIGESLS